MWILKQLTNLRLILLPLLLGFELHHVNLVLQFWEPKAPEWLGEDVRELWVLMYCLSHHIPCIYLLTFVVHQSKYRSTYHWNKAISQILKLRFFLNLLLYKECLPLTHYEGLTPESRLFLLNKYSKFAFKIPWWQNDGKAFSAGSG
jgi:hypothetical protein